MRNQEKTTGQSVRLMKDKEGKYLTFSLGREEYGISILKVREIIGMMSITAMPKTPDYMKGVINLRGKIIPVVSLRVKFSMEETQYTERTCMIVVEVKGVSEPIQVGLVVDSVSEVINVKAEEMEESPAVIVGNGGDFILGIAKLGSGVKILLDIDRVVDSGGLVSLSEAA